MKNNGRMSACTEIAAAVTDPVFRATLLDNLFDGVYFVDLQRTIAYWNQGSERLTGYSSSEALGRHCFENFLAHVDEGGCALCTGGCPLSQTIQDGQPREADLFLRHKDGHRLAVCVRVAPIKDEVGKIVGAVEVFSDATAKERAERRVLELERLAFKDSLTSLANRRYCELRLKQMIEEYEQFNRIFGVLLVDIDHFKRVNDTHGHDVGDLILKSVSETLSNSVRRGDDFLGRWGGEEFLAILPDVTPHSLRDLAERCRALVEQSDAAGDDGRVRVTASIGATLTMPEDSPESIVKRADRLMYESKKAGRNRVTAG